MSRRLIDHIIQIHARGVPKGVIYRALAQRVGGESAKRMLKQAGLSVTISDLLRGRHVTDSTREKLREAQTGKKASKETIAKMSASQKGRTVPDDVRTKISTTLMGHSVAERTRKRIAASLRRYQARRKLSLRRWELKTASRLEAFKSAN